MLLENAPQPWHDFPLLSELWLPSLVPCTSSYNLTAIIDVGSGNFRTPSYNFLSYIFFGTPLSLTKKLKAFLIQFLQCAYFGTLLTLPVILKLLSQLLQFMLPSLFNLPPNLQRNAPLLLSHLCCKKKKKRITYIHVYSS